VPQDFRRAYYWFNLAAADGDVEAGMWRDCVLPRLTPKDLAEIQEQTRAALEDREH
jgi:TPR repeat protein